MYIYIYMYVYVYIYIYISLNFQSLFYVFLCLDIVYRLTTGISCFLCYEHHCSTVQSLRAPREETTQHEPGCISVCIHRANVRL